MINASNVAMEFHMALPAMARPETTEGYQASTICPSIRYPNYCSQPYCKHRLFLDRSVPAFSVFQLLCSM